MKRTIIAVISMVLILFAFSACRPTVVGIPVDPTPGTDNPGTPVTPAPDTSVKDVNSYDGLRAALIDPEVKTINLTSDLTLDPDEIAVLEFTKSGLTFNGNKHTITVTSSGTGSTSNAPDYLFDIKGTGITFKDVNIAVTDKSLCTWAINVNANGFTFDGGSITGTIYLDEDYSTVNIGFAISANTTGTAIKNVELKGNYTPVSASSPAFELYNVKFESGMEIDYISEATKITECSEIPDADYNAAINIHSSADEASMLKFMEENDVIVTADGKTYNEMLASDISDFVDDVSKSSVQIEMETAVKAMGDNVLESGTLPEDLSVLNLLEFLADSEKVAAVMESAKGETADGLNIEISDYSISSPVGFTIRASAEDYSKIFKTSGYTASGSIDFTFTGELNLSYPTYGACFVCESYTASSDGITLTSPGGEIYEVTFSNFTGNATFIVDPKNATDTEPARIDFVISDFEIPTESDAEITVNGYPVEYADIYAGTDQGATI